MIEVVARLDSGEELARIRISNVSIGSGETADYAVEFAVERGTEIGLHRRVIHSFPRKSYNVLGLLKQALETLSEEEMRLVGGFASASDLERGLERARRSLP